MKPPPYLKLLCLAALMVCSAFAQTKTVLKNVGANTLTESFIVPSGASITVAPGASIINQGTATGFDTSITVPWSNITGKPTTLSGFGITDGLTSATAASTYLTQASATSTYLTQSAAASTYLTSATASSTYLTLSAATSTYLTQAAAASTYLTSSSASSTYLTQAAAASTYLTSSSAASTYLTSASASSTYLALSAAASTYLTQAAAIAGYQPKDADLTSIAGLSTTEFGRSLLTQPSAAASRQTMGVETLAPPVSQVTEVAVVMFADGAYADIPYDAVNVLRVWWNVDAGGNAPPPPTSGSLAAVNITTTTSPEDAAAALASVINGVNGLAATAVGWIVTITQPAGELPGVDVSAFGGATSSQITGGVAAYTKLLPSRADDLVLQNQAVGAIPYFDGAIWQALLTAGINDQFLKFSAGSVPEFTTLQRPRFARLTADVQTNSSNFSTLLTLSLSANQTYLVMAVCPHVTSASTEGSYVALNSDGAFDHVVYASFSMPTFASVNATNVATTFDSKVVGGLSGPGLTYVKPFLLFGFVKVGPLDAALQLRGATEIGGTPYTIFRAGTAFAAFPIDTFSP